MQLSLFPQMSKKDEKQITSNIKECLNVFTRPIIVMRGYEHMSIPDKIKNRITIERLSLVKDGIKQATQTEALWYISSVSLLKKLSPMWFRIYTHLFYQWAKSTEQEIPDFIEKMPLTSQEQTELSKLKNWIYKQSNRRN